MRIIYSIALVGVLAFFLSCESKNSEPNYPITPYVEFRDLKFINGNATNGFKDSLNLIFYLRDGDGDLGLDLSSSPSPPYNFLFVLNKANGQLLAVNDIPNDHPF